MKKMYKAFKLPLRTITNKPLYFVFWLVVLTFFGLLPLWFSIVKGFTITSFYCEWALYLHNKGLITFSIVVLASSLANAFLAKESGMTDDTAAVRAISSVVCIFILIFNTFLLSLPSSYEIYDETNHLQLFLFVISYLLAIYMFCFKDSKWEETADSVRQQDDEGAKKLDMEASAVTRDKSGVKV